MNTETQDIIQSIRSDREWAASVAQEAEVYHSLNMWHSLCKRKVLNDKWTEHHLHLLSLRE